MKEASSKKVRNILDIGNDISKILLAIKRLVSRINPSY
jgi:hypothetical protein